MAALSSSYNTRIVLDVIDKGLDALGKSPKQAIWVFLEKDFDVKRSELPKNIREFSEGMQKIFGLGYKFLDVLFCNYLKEATGKMFPKDQSFVDCVESLFNCNSDGT